jgi:DNA-binding MarR family transcriptional regulator
MNVEQVTKKQIEDTRMAISQSSLLRLAGLGDLIDRFVRIKLKKRINWVKALALIYLILSGGVMTPGEMGRRLLRPKDHISRLLDRLVKDGVVTRYRKGKDRRNVEIKLTPSGLRFLGKILIQMKKEETPLESYLGDGDFDLFQRLLKTFRHNLIKELTDRL